MSERVSLGETDELGTGAMTVLPVTDISVVRQTAEKNAASTALQREDARAPDQSRTTSVTPSNTSGSGRSGGTAASPIGVSRHSVSAIDDEAYQFVVTAFDAYGRQDYDIAENKYLQALDIEPNHADALAGLGAVYQRTGRTDLAAANYQRLLGVDPGNTLAASALISLRSAEVDWDTESELKHLLQRFPLAHHLHFALASHFVEQGRWADARYEFRAAQELAPDNADYNFNLAVSLERLGDFAGARRYYESAILHAGGSANVDKQAIAQHLAKMTAPERERL
jgi:Flp pilus assembly protein TadD